MLFLNQQIKISNEFYCRPLVHIHTHFSFSALSFFLLYTSTHSIVNALHLNNFTATTKYKCLQTNGYTRLCQTCFFFYVSVQRSVYAQYAIRYQSEFNMLELCIVIIIVVVVVVVVGGGCIRTIACILPFYIYERSSLSLQSVCTHTNARHLVNSNMEPFTISQLFKKRGKYSF